MMTNNDNQQLFALDLTAFSWFLSVDKKIIFYEAFLCSKIIWKIFSSMNELMDRIKSYFRKRISELT